MAYASIADVQSRMSRIMSESEESICGALLEDAKVIIDSYENNASSDAKKVVSCRMVIRALGSDGSMPVGATQGTMSALGYSQTWTMSNGYGELYLSKADKKMLGISNRLGCHSVIE